MPDLDVGRIFWKEWRAQRSFWLGLFVLSIGLEILILFVWPFRPTDATILLHIHQGLVIVLACSFATGSAAIAFAGEVEAKTKGLLQRIPVRSRDLLAGKLSLSLAGSYALLVALWLAGALMLMRSTAEPLLSVASFDASLTTFGGYLLAPLVFVVVGGLFSLMLSDVLHTVLIAGISTAVLLSVPAIRDHLALQAVLIAAVGAGDVFLARRWLHAAGAVEWTGLPRIRLPQFVERPLRPRAQVKASIEPLRSPVAWRRSASSLVWKEFRQAFPFCLTLLVAGLIAMALIPLSNLANLSMGSGIGSLILIAFAPLLPGVAAMRAERRDGAFRLLTNRGVAPEGFLICKHLVWLSLSLLVFAVLFLTDRIFLANPSNPARPPSLWDFAAEVGQETFDAPTTSVTAPLAVAAFHVVLLYALGFLMGLLLPGPIVAFFTATIVGLALAFCWAVVAALGIPFWWTIGLFPVIFLAVAWVRTADWLIPRNTRLARATAGAVFVVPLLGILAGTAAFRITQIPAAVIPQSVLELGAASTAGPAVLGKKSLFVDAMDSLSGPPPTPTVWSRAASPISTGNQAVLRTEGWQFATAENRDWVARNSPARKLALDAVQREPGSFPFQVRIEFDDRAASFSVLPKAWWLVQLLLDSARELESQDRLGEALSCYIAVARMESDAHRSGQLGAHAFSGSYSCLALDWMQRWAAHPKQSTEQIKKAIRTFQSMEPLAEGLSADILQDWWINRRRLRSSIWHEPLGGERDRAVPAQRWMRWVFPWETVRLERLVDAIYAADLNEAETIETDFRQQGFVLMTSARLARWDRQNAVPWKYTNTTLAAPASVELPYWEPENYVDRLAMERMNLTALAIADFQREHHKPPDALRMLVPTYFERLPVDPWTGGEFEYEPRGVRGMIDTRQGKFEPSTPFLASAGLLDSHLVFVKQPRGGFYDWEVVSRFAPANSSKTYRGAEVFPAPILPLPR